MICSNQQKKLVVIRKFMENRSKKPSVDYKPEDLPEATAFKPGSAGKVIELIQRVENNQQLWHPQDAGYDGKD